MRATALVAINPIDLDGSAIVAELSKIAELKEQGGVASVKTDFLISNRRITTDHFVLDVGRVPMALSGWTDFDGRLDYRINLKGLNDRLPDKARRFLSDLNVDLQNLKVLTLQGTVNKMVVHLNGVALDRDILREAGHQRQETGPGETARSGKKGFWTKLFAKYLSVVSCQWSVVSGQLSVADCQFATCAEPGELLDFGDRSV